MNYPLKDNSIDHLLGLLTDSAMTVSGTDRSIVTLFDSRGSIVNTYARNFDELTDSEENRHLFEIMRYAHNNIYPMSSFDNIFQDKFSKYTLQYSRRSFVCVPISCAKDKSFGSLYLEKNNVEEFDNNALQILSTLADLLSASLMRSGFYEDELEIVLNNVEAGIFVVDGDFTIYQSNSSAAEIFNAGIDEVTGKSLFGLTSSRLSGLQSAMQIALRTGKRSSCNFFITKSDNPEKRIYIESSITPLPDDLGKLRFLLTFNDTTERNRFLTEAAQREKMAAIGTLAAGIAHEFNNIWSAVHGYAELARSNDKFLNDLVDVTLEQAGRASEIIQSLLSFSDKRQEFRRGIKLNRILKGVIQLVDMELRSRSIDLSIKVEGNPDVIGNEGQLQQVFLNLVINASHAVGTGGNIDITLKEEGKYAAVYVKDNGVGMSEENMGHIFDPFFTTKGALGGDEKENGHGLGLTLTYNLVTAHEGFIDVSSKKGEGSCFKVFIPVEPDTDESKIAPAFKVEEEQSKDRKLNILVVDDEILLQRLITSMLDYHEVDSVSSGAAALSLLDRKGYDLVFVDIVLEGEMNGFVLIDKISEINADLPVVIITGRSDEAKLKDYAERVMKVISKPFTVGDIIGIVNSICSTD
ncbi:MAG: ATP-binding protein [Planctomycetota bacterium]|jgi:PAS domain S-box-containing protein